MTSKLQMNDDDVDDDDDDDDNDDNDNDDEWYWFLICKLIFDLNDSYEYIKGYTTLKQNTTP